MFKQNILKLSYCAIKISLMSNLNRYIFLKLESVTLRKFHAMFLKVVNLNVDFILILSFNFLAFSHRETRNYSFKRETVKFT